MRDDTVRMLTLKDAAGKTGVSYYALRKLCIDGVIPSFMLGGGKRLVNFDKLCDYLNGEGIHDGKDCT